MSQTRISRAPPRPVRRRRRGRLGLLHLVWAALVATVAALAVLSFTGRALVLPERATARIEAAVNARLDGGGLRIGRTEVLFGSDGRPRLRFRTVAVTDAGGAPVAMANQLGIGLSAAALVHGRIEPTALRLSGAEITVRRDAEGAFSVDFGGTGAGAARLGAAMTVIERLFAEGALRSVARIEAEDVTLALEDARAGRVWHATGGRLGLANGSEGLAITVAAELFNGTEDLAPVELAYVAPPGGAGARLSVGFESAAAADIAVQSPALAVLALLDAPISGGMEVSLDAEGQVAALDVALDIGAGRFRPAPEAQPLRFEAANATLSYLPETGRVEITRLAIAAEALRAEGRGHLLLGDLRAGWPARMAGQLRLDDLEVGSAGLFAAPLRFDAAQADLRVTLAPFALDIGQLALSGGLGAQVVSGRIAAAPEGWRLALDLDAPEVALQTALALWPVVAAPGTRDWVARNVRGGQARNLALALRMAPGGTPVTAFSFVFDEAEVRVMEHLPPIRGASGEASLSAARFALALSGGEMSPSEGAPADLAGTAFVVPDTRVPQGPAELRLAAAAPLPSLLRLLDNPPFRVLSRTERPGALLATEAAAELAGTVHLAMKPRLAPEEVRYAIAGRLRGVAAADLVPGRALAADDLALTVTPETLQVTGPVRLDGMAMEAAFRQPLAPGAGSGEVTAQLALTPETLAGLGIALPPGLLRGAASSEVTLALSPDAPVRFRLTSDLVGARLTLPAIGWSKAAGTAGRLEAEGEIAGQAARIDRLVLSAPGLSAEGQVAPGPDGPPVLRFDRVRVGRWLDAPVTLAMRGPGRPPAVTVSGGTLDIGGLPQGSGTAGPPMPMTIRLDRLQIGAGLALTGFRGEMTGGAGLSGQFQARVNGGVPVSGTLAPAQGGTAVRVAATDAGAVLRDAGLFRNGRGGAFDLVLVPAGTPGHFRGQLTVGRTRVVDAPGLAGLLDAISIVGLVDELEGQGILFDTVDARFDLTPGRVVVRQGAAVGASLGISMDGVYDIATRRTDMQGVISPVYLLNGIGQILTRPGEGLFGFAYRMHGPEGAVRVEVNPLSILTPGMFREIFRRPLPGATP